MKDVFATLAATPSPKSPSSCSRSLTRPERRGARRGCGHRLSAGRDAAEHGVRNRRGRQKPARSVITRCELGRLLLPGGCTQCARLRALGSSRPSASGGSRPGAQPGLASLALVTTCSPRSASVMRRTRRRAREAGGYELLKLKLDAERHVDLVRIVREEQPRARLLVDANQAWSRPLLERLLPRPRRARRRAHRATRAAP